MVNPYYKGLMSVISLRLGPEARRIYVLEPGWGSLGSKLEVLEVQIGGLGGLLGSMLNLVARR